MDPGLARDVLTVALGVLTGIMSGLFGVGGAVISTPGIRALGAPAILAIGSTLPSIIPGAASGTARYASERLVDWQVVGLTAPAGIVMAVVGALLARHVPGDGHLLMLVTAGLLGYSALRMLHVPDTTDQLLPDPALTGLAETDVEALPDRREHTGATDGVPADPTSRGPTDPGRAASGAASDRPQDGRAGRRPARFVLVGAIAGSLSGLLGIGGGIVMVPGFTQFGDLPVKTAIGSSLACVGLFAIPGTITHALLGNIDWRFALLLAVGIVPGARIGAALAIRSDDRRLRLVVSTFLGLMAVAYGLGETLALVG